MNNNGHSFKRKCCVDILDLEALHLEERSRHQNNIWEKVHGWHLKPLERTYPPLGMRLGQERRVHRTTSTKSMFND